MVRDYWLGEIPIFPSGSVPVSGKKFPYYPGTFDPTSSIVSCPGFPPGKYGNPLPLDASNVTRVCVECLSSGSKDIMGGDKYFGGCVDDGTAYSGLMFETQKC